MAWQTYAKLKWIMPEYYHTHLTGFYGQFFSNVTLLTTIFLWKLNYLTELLADASKTLH